MLDSRASDSDDDLTPLVGKARYDAVVAERDRLAQRLEGVMDLLRRYKARRAEGLYEDDPEWADLDRDVDLALFGER